MFTTLVVWDKVALMALAFVALVLWTVYEHYFGRNRRRHGCGHGHRCGDNIGVSPVLEAAMTEKPAGILAQPLTTGRRCRLRELGIVTGVLPTGPHNAITDAGVLVGHTTLISGDGELVPGKGPVRTGVTVIVPHPGDVWNVRASAGSFVLNGNGSVTGLDWIQESGMLDGPIALTNTHSVGDVYSGMVRWLIRKHPQIGITDDTYLPVVGECDDSPLNDIQGFHVKPEHVMAALDTAAGGDVAEGTVGGGTGMTCYEFKGGIGTSSRVVEVGDKKYTVGVLVNCNHGGREQLKVMGVPVGRILDAEMATEHTEGSIVMIVATDAPLSGRQLNRVARRAVMGLALTGSTANNSSGDFVVAFSNGRLVPRDEQAVRTLPELSDDFITPLFQATVEATEEAVFNALCMATTVVGRDGNISPALPLDRLVEIMREYGR